ncbi:hypothetical protein BJY52DRAFT_1264661 [Lactarius psammicola]|nr:hypothetical protein BJY52DRAFT_1264661 [Lactarius psammicola]
MIGVHLYLPVGAQKDGLSAGITMVCAIVSLLTGKSISPTTAMAGGGACVRYPLKVF